MTESPNDLLREAERGRSARTPAIALMGVTLAVAALVLAISAVAMVVYFVFR